MKNAKLLAAMAVVAAGTITLPAMAGTTLDAVKKRDYLVCGVNTSAPGFGGADSQGVWMSTFAVALLQLFWVMPRRLNSFR